MPQPPDAAEGLPRPVLDDRARGVGLTHDGPLGRLLDQKRWCVWDWMRSGARWTKVPRVPGTLVGQKVNSLSTCVTYIVARAAVLAGDGDGVGRLTLGDLDVVWLDADHCRDPGTGELDPWVLAVLDMAPGAYAEVTPSGTGIRIAGAGGLDVPFQGRLMMGEFLGAQDADGLKAWGGTTDCHPRAMIEIFCGVGRYLTTTGWDAAGSLDVDLCGLGFELWQLGEAQRAHGRRATVLRAAGSRQRTASTEDIAAALGVMVNDELTDWHEWTRVGMAAHAASGGDPDAYEAWRAWSEKREDRYDPAACMERWAHWFDSPGTDVGFGSLRYLAREAVPGWTPPSKARADEFDTVPEAEAGSQPLASPPGKFDDPGVEDGPGSLAFRLLAARVIYVVKHHRYQDRETFLLLDEPRLRLLAEELRVPGAQARGGKSLVARLAHPDSGMRRAHSLTMRPGQGALVMEDDGRLHANIWQAPRLVPWTGATEEDARPWLEHARRLIPNEADRNRVLDRLAWAIQHPGRKINSALVLLGDQMTGKDTFLQPFWMAIGENNRAVVQGSKLGGQFNGYFEAPWLLISEMPPAQKRDVYDDIKGAMTTPPDRVRINRKGVEEFEIPNIVNVAITSNHIDAIALAEDDRRFDVVGTSMAAVGEDRDAYYTGLRGWYARGGYEAVAGYLAARDVSAFNPYATPPMTTAKLEMALEAHPAVAWARSLWAEEGPLGRRHYLTVDEVMDMHRRGVWGAERARGRGLPQHIMRAMRADGWAYTGVQILEGGASNRPRVWYRGPAPELVAQLPPLVMREKLEEDRRKEAGSEF